MKSVFTILFSVMLFTISNVSFAKGGGGGGGGGKSGGAPSSCGYDLLARVQYRCAFESLAPPEKFGLLHEVRVIPLFLCKSSLRGKN